MATVPAAKPAKARKWTGVPIGRWVTIRKSVQALILVVFLGLFVLSRSLAAPAWLANLPMRLDPLAMLAHALASRSLLAGSAVALITLLLTLVLGRAWCGWLCPLGTTLDWIAPRRTKDANARAGRFEGLRSVKYGLLVTILFAALLGNLTLLILDPLTLLIRSLTTSVWPAIDQAVIAAEKALYAVPFLSEPISRVDSFLRPVLLPSEPMYYRDAALFLGVFAGVIALNWLAPRFWCRYLCPLGGLLGLVGKVALFRREPGEGCKACVICTQSCPTGTIDPDDGFKSDPGECTLCLDCLESCPRSSIALHPRLRPERWMPYDPGRRQALGSFATAAAGLALFRADAFAKREHPFLLRPPGARENDLTARCLRCGDCLRACPTAALQPALTEAGLEGLWTPVAVPRLGYCDYGCNACGQICPVQAIPPLPLSEKREQVIGKAYINQNRCLAWSDHTPCIVCEEMCPRPDKAIRLQETEFTDAEGNAVSIQLPSVLRERCIGCGICEYKCPVNGEAAIRVYVPGTEVPF